MITIIQLSDFHIKASMPEPQNNAAIKTFVNYAKKIDLGTIILVYNGDVIDSNVIRKSLAENMTSEEKAEEWDRQAEKAFRKAETYFTYIMEALGITNDHVIICCGNHDVNNYYDCDAEFMCPYDKGDMPVPYTEKRFAQWDAFCQNMKFMEVSHQNMIREINGINFIVSNSQWRDKYTGGSKTGLCLNCKTLTDLFATSEQKLVRAANGEKTDNVFVSHAPLGDFCEKELHAWRENNYHSYIKMINNTCGLLLFGDKHTDTTLGAEYIVGAPLDPADHRDRKQRITYYLHQFNDETVYHRALVYEDRCWKSSISNRDIKRILEPSRNSLKPQALNYLFQTTDILLLPQKIFDFELYKNREKWDALNNIFQIYVKISHVLPNNRAEQISCSPFGIFDTLRSVISECGAEESKVNMIVQGSYRSGKSIFMTLLYLNLLHGFCSGTFKDIPVYINLEYWENQNTLKTSIADILDMCVSMVKDSNSKVCLMIDGIPQYLYARNSEYEEVKNIVKSRKYENVISKFVYCIDKNDNLEYDVCSFYKEKAEYLVYFDSIMTQNFSEIKKYFNFLQAFCILEECEDQLELVKTNFDSLCFKNIDFCLVTLLKDLLLSDSEIDLTEELEAKILRRLHATNEDLKSVAEAAFLVYYQNQPIEEVKKAVSDISDDAIQLILKYKIFSQFLIAFNYVNVMESLVSGNKLSPVERSVLNQLYDDDITKFIVQYINKNIASQTVISFERKHYAKLDFAGQSTLTYIVGKVYHNRDQLITVLNQEEKALDKAMSHEKKLGGRRLYEYYVAKRSIEICRTRNDRLYYDKNEYIIKLMVDKNERRINRNFYLEFYGDRTKSELNLQREVILKGLDFYNTYHILASRLENWKNTKAEDHLSRLELFTLCDLIQTRLDYPKITFVRIRNELKPVNTKTEEASLFYNPNYNNDKQHTAVKIIEFALEMIEFYLTRNVGGFENDVFAQYLFYEKDIFNDVKDKLMVFSSDFKFKNRRLFDILIGLEHTRKIGWHFRELPKNITQDDIDRHIEGKPFFENVLEHTYEAYLMGLLYLPNEDIHDSQYKKQDVLNMLLIHDLGESVVGDYPPSFMEYERILKEENIACRSFYFSGQHPEYATMIDYLKLWNDWADRNSNNINVTIAKEIDKIQMLYKLLSLVCRDEVEFTNKRFHNFFSAISNIKTDKAKAIYNQLIANNADFVAIARKYEYDIVAL